MRDTFSMAKSEKEIISFRLESPLKEALDAIAASMERDRSYVLSEAVTLYLNVHQWQLTDVQQAIAEADAGDFATDDEVNKTFGRWLPPHADSMA